NSLTFRSSSSIFCRNARISSMLAAGAALLVASCADIFRPLSALTAIARVKLTTLEVGIWCFPGVCLFGAWCFPPPRALCHSNFIAVPFKTLILSSGQRQFGSINGLSFRRRSAVRFLRCWRSESHLLGSLNLHHVGLVDSNLHHPK